MHRLERHAGTAAVAVALCGILLATLVDPTFSWTGDALSDLGVRSPSAPIFNGAMILAGILGIGYASGLLRGAETVERRGVAAIFGIASISLAGVGLFVIGHPLHAPAALGFYLLATLAMLVDGFHRRNRPSGLVTLALVAVQVAIWATWSTGAWPGDGIALPESAGAMVVAIWIVATGPVPTLGPPVADDRRSRMERG